MRAECVHFLLLAACGLVLITAGLERKPPAPVNVHVNAGLTVARVPPWYRGFTTDWWRYNEQRNNNGQKWGNTGMLTLDLTSTRLRNLAKALSPASWRIGGSHQDLVVYVVGRPPECDQDRIAQSLRSPGPLCLTKSRWASIIRFADWSGLKVIFGLNGMYGRPSMDKAFNATNAVEFLRYTAQNDFRVYAFELSNEILKKRKGASPKVLASDFVTVRQHINELWPNAIHRPLLAGPDNKPSERVLALLDSDAFEALDAATYHSYCNEYTICTQRMLDGKTLHCLDDARSMLSFIDATRAHRKRLSQSHAARNSPVVWASEVGPHNQGGVSGCTDRFVDVFWYLDQLGSLARMGVQIFTRQTLVGGDYGLLDKDTFKPRPDYFAAWLWGRLMGQDHLEAIIMGHSRAFLRVFATKNITSSGRTRITLLFVNLHRQPCKVSVSITAEKASVLAGVREEYHVRPTDEEKGIFSSGSEFKDAFGDWVPLQLDENDSLPELDPVVSSVNDSLILHPTSYTFVTFTTSVSPQTSSYGLFVLPSGTRSFYVFELLLIFLLFAFCQRRLRSYLLCSSLRRCWTQS